MSYLFMLSVIPMETMTYLEEKMNEMNKRLPHIPHPDALKVMNTTPILSTRTIHVVVLCSCLLLAVRTV